MLNGIHFKILSSEYVLCYFLNRKSHKKDIQKHVKLQTLQVFSIFIDLVYCVVFIFWGSVSINRTSKLVGLNLRVRSISEYEQSFKVQINRKSRAFLRLLKNKSVKFEVYYKRWEFVILNLRQSSIVCVFNFTWLLDK